MKSIKLQKTQSLLMQIIPQALCSLKDNRINSLCITAVDCKNGKYDAKVYYDGSDYTKEEQKKINLLLNKANGHIKSYCLTTTSWYKCPNFTFEADNMLEYSSKMEVLFDKIKSQKENKGR